MMQEKILKWLAQLTIPSETTVVEKPSTVPFITISLRGLGKIELQNIQQLVLFVKNPFVIHLINQVILRIGDELNETNVLGWSSKRTKESGKDVQNRTHRTSDEIVDGNQRTKDSGSKLHTILRRSEETHVPVSDDASGDGAVRTPVDLNSTEGERPREDPLVCNKCKDLLESNPTASPICMDDDCIFFEDEFDDCDY